MRWHKVTAILAVGLASLVLLGGCVAGVRPSPSPALVGPSALPSSSPLAWSSPSPEPSADTSPKPTEGSGAPGSAAVLSAAWHATGDMITPHAFHTSTLLSDGKVLVVGGRVNVQDGEVSATAELYDPTSGAWNPAGSMTEARWDHVATLLSDGRVLVAGGQSSAGDQLASAELYDPGSERWTATGSMHKVRSGHTATLLPDGRVLVAGGYDFEGARKAQVEIMGMTAAELYDPNNGRWTVIGGMTEARAGSTATLLRDGRVLVAGGDVGGDPGRSAELYDPGTGRWTATGSMTQARRNHTATLLPDGKVLVTGGFAGSGYTGPSCSSPPAPCSAELYDPSDGSWTATGRMHTDRIGHTATLLPEGTVLVVGLGTYVTPASAEVYDPGSGQWTATASPAEVRGFALTLLLDGRALVTGDFSDNSRAAELYDPGDGT